MDMSDGANSSKCRQQLLDLSAYLEGDLTPAAMAELDAHVAACECCGRMAASLRRAIALCRSDAARDLPPDVRARALERVRTLLGAQAAGKPPVG
jgi:anti-sigma factor RsiW